MAKHGGVFNDDSTRPHRFRDGWFSLISTWRGGRGGWSPYGRPANLGLASLTSARQMGPRSGQMIRPVSPFSKPPNGTIKSLANFPLGALGNSCISKASTLFLWCLWSRLETIQRRTLCRTSI